MQNDVIHFYQAAVTVKMGDLLVCFCGFDLSCPILKKRYIYRKFVYCIVLSHWVAFFLNLVCFNVIQINVGEANADPSTRGWGSV